MAGDSLPRARPRCERAREWSSLHLDGELSDLEQALLERHIAVCDDCRAFDAGLRSTRTLLVSREMESPSRTFEPPARRRLARPTRRRLAVAGIAVAAAALGSIVGSVLESPPKQAPAPTARVVLLPFEVTQQVPELKPRGERPPTPDAQEQGCARLPAGGSETCMPVNFS